MSNFNDGVFILDKDGTVVYTDSSILETLECEDFIGKNIKNLLDDNIDVRLYRDSYNRGFWRFYSLKIINKKPAYYSEIISQSEINFINTDRIKIYCDNCNKAFKELEERDNEK